LLVNNMKANISRRRLTGLKNSLLYLKQMG
jgi:hypothetical protein